MFIFSPHKRIHLVFSGHVQSIGFRQTALITARSLRLTGWVKNLDSGQVEILAEGNPKSIFKFIEKIDKSFSDNIDVMEIEWLRATGEFKKFDILQNVIIPNR